MMGAAGALCCLTAGTALGHFFRDRRLSRLRMLRAEMDALSGMRLLLEQERLSMPQLLAECAHHARPGSGGEQVSRRLLSAAHALAAEPLLGVAGAYEQACRAIPMPWEQAEERAAMQCLFAQLGSGTAAMRAQAAATCLRRLKPLEEAANAHAQTGGKLCMQLGVLLGLMAGIALW